MIKANEELRQYWHPTAAYWRCDKCQAVCSIAPRGVKAWFAASIVERQHRNIAPFCEFDPDQIRVKLTPFDVQAEDTKGI